MYLSIVCSFNMYVSISSFLNYVKGGDPSPPHASKKGQKKCDSCHFFMSDLEPHPECSNSYHVLAVCTVPALTIKKSSSTTKGPRGESVKGGNKAAKVYPAVPSYPKLIPPVGSE